MKLIQLLSFFQAFSLACAAKLGGRNNSYDLFCPEDFSGPFDVPLGNSSFCTAVYVPKPGYGSYGRWSNETIPYKGRAFGLTKPPKACKITKTTNRLLFNTTLDDFIMRSGSRCPCWLDWYSDGCTDSIDEPMGFNFKLACMRHDFGYQNTRAQNRFTPVLKKRIDDNFKQDLTSICNKPNVWSHSVCSSLIRVYHAGVELFGGRDAKDIAKPLKAKIQKKLNKRDSSDDHDHDHDDDNGQSEDSEDETPPQGSASQAKLQNKYEDAWADFRKELELERQKGRLPPNATKVDEAIHDHEKWMNSTMKGSGKHGAIVSKSNSTHWNGTNNLWFNATSPSHYAQKRSG